MRIIQFILNWYRDRRLRSDRLQYQRGYEWATKILRDSNGQEDPSDYISGFGFNRTRTEVAFDRGVLAAMFDFFR